MTVGWCTRSSSFTTESSTKWMWTSSPAGSLISTRITSMAMTGMTMTGMTSSTLTEANSQMDINHAADENRLQRFSLQRPIIKEKSRLAHHFYIACTIFAGIQPRVLPNTVWNSANTQPFTSKYTLIRVPEESMISFRLSSVIRS